MVKAMMVHVMVIVAAALFVGSVSCGDHQGLGLQLGLGPYAYQLGGHALAGGAYPVVHHTHSLGGYAAGGHGLAGYAAGGHGLAGYAAGGHGLAGYGGHIVSAAYGPPPPALNLDFAPQLNLGGHGHGHAYAAPAPQVVKKVVAPVVLKKPLATYHDYDTNAFIPVQKAPVYHQDDHHHHHDHHHHDEHYHGGSEFSIVPSISYGYSYKLVPTDSFGHHDHYDHHHHEPAAPVHHDAHGNGGHLGLDFGLNLGGDGGHHHDEHHH